MPGETKTPATVVPAAPGPATRWSWGWLMGLATGLFTGLSTGLTNLVLGTEEVQRRSLRLLLMAMLIYTVCLSLMAYGAMEDIFDPVRISWLALSCVLANIAFYVLIRAGFSRHFAARSMDLQQILAAQTLLAGGYAFTGPVHSGVLIMFSVTMVFGMFNLGAAGARQVAAYTILLLGGVMLWCSQTDPLVYRPQLELFYFVLLSTVLLSIAQLASQLAQMRERLQSQKTQLELVFAQIQAMATHDELTGLNNRRCMMGLIEEHALRFARGGPPFYLAMADLDHFKSVNDLHGHAVGDEALRAFANQAGAVLRTTDIVSRWGGEEFLLLMPESAPGIPAVGIDRLRASLALVQVSQTVPGLRLAFSAGMTRFRPGEAIEHAILRADQAMYDAKQAGRDRTVIA